MCLTSINKFKTESDFNAYFTSEQFCIEYFIKLRWPNGVECVQCTSKNVCTFENDRTRFKCRDCKKIYSHLVGTIFQNTKKSLRVWFKVIFKFLLDDATDTYALADYHNVTQTTAWKMLHAIRFAFKDNDHKFLFGETENARVQIDEAGIQGENKKRHLEDKIVGCGGRSPYGIKIIGLFDPTTLRVKLQLIPNTLGVTLKAVVRKFVKPGTDIITDDWGGYNGLDESEKTEKENAENETRFFKRHIVNHSKKQYTNGNFHTQHIESIWTKVKNALEGTYKCISEKLAQLYLDEQTFKINATNAQPATRFNTILGLSVKCTLTRWQLVNGFAA